MAMQCPNCDKRIKSDAGMAFHASWCKPAVVAAEPTAQPVREIRRGPADAECDMLSGRGWTLPRADAERMGLIAAGSPVISAEPRAVVDYSAPAGLRFEPVTAAEPVSSGHLGYSWTIEGGVVEVLAVGASIVRAPLSNAIADGRRLGREWWPAGVQFEPMWRGDTFATIDEARAAYTAYTLERAPAAAVTQPEPDPEPDPTPPTASQPVPADYTGPVQLSPSLAASLNFAAGISRVRRAPRRVSAVSLERKLSGPKVASPKAPKVGAGKHVRCVHHEPMPRAAGVDGVAYACFDVEPDAAAIAERRAFVDAIDAAILAHHAAELARPTPDGLVVTSLDGSQRGRWSYFSQPFSRGEIDHGRQALARAA